MSEPTVKLHPSDIPQFASSPRTARTHGDRELDGEPKPHCKVSLRIALVVLAVAGVTVSASSADAASSATCTGSSAVSYSPGLTNTPQNLSWTIADTYSSCTSTDTSLTAGAYSGGFALTGASCNGA
ncbi:MAG: hypothetical protein ABIY55_27510, partial [Kofleriaceae bacterium]